MLKFTNIEKTSVNFNDASFTLTSPEDWESIGDGPTRESILAWLSVEGNVPELFPNPTVAEIKTERNKRKSGGFLVDAMWFHSDDASRGQYSILLSLAIEKSLPTDYILSQMWKTMSGTFTPISVSLLRQIRDVGLILEQQLFTTAETHRLNMEASENPETYDYSINWPAVYV